MITLIAAVAKNGAIGNENKLIYWLPDDLKRFKALTTGHTIVMGRRTFESLPKGALPNRRNVVLSRNRQFTAPGIEVFASLQEALASCASDEEVFVIGGASVYREAMPLADRLCLTLVDDTPVRADAFFPEILAAEWRIASDEPHDPDDRHAYAFRFVDFLRP
jgi:dihydrofolate reductase